MLWIVICSVESERNFPSFKICKKWNVLKFKEFWLTANFWSCCIVYSKGNRRSRRHKFTCTLRCFCIQIHIAIWNTVWYHHISFKKYTICFVIYQIYNSQTLIIRNLCLLIFFVFVFCSFVLKLNERKQTIFFHQTKFEIKKKK